VNLRPYVEILLKSTIFAHTKLLYCPRCIILWMYIFSFHYTATFDALYFDNLKVISDHSVKIKINHLLGRHSVISEEKNCHPLLSLRCNVAN
jgi:hypothetical protein